MDIKLMMMMMMMIYRLHLNSKLIYRLQLNSQLNSGLTMSVCGADVRPVECVCDLGVLFDSNMTLLNHVNNVAGICFYQLRIIRRSLTTEAAHSLVRPSSTLESTSTVTDSSLPVRSTCTQSYSVSSVPPPG